ncbi:MAG: hypothetical protein Q7T61_16175 [Caulobacter sp.]|nr:hypothetical protein [Caulobacter sp.]
MRDIWTERLNEGVAALQTGAEFELDRIIALPGFHDAAHRATLAERNRRIDDPVLFKASHDLGRYLAWAFAAYLDATPDGVTHASLTRALDEAGAASRGRARVTLLFLQAIGYITPRPRGEDGRERRYALTPVMARAIVSHYRRILDGAAPVMAPAARALSLLDEPAFLRLYGAAQGEIMLRTLKTVQRPDGPSLDLYIRRAGGLHLLSHLATSGEAGDVFPPTRPMALSVSAMARDSAISRAQVRRLLTDSEAAGFVRREPDDRLTVTPLLGQHIIWWTAIRFYSADLAARIALGRWDEAKTLSSAGPSNDRG